MWSVNSTTARGRWLFSGSGLETVSNFSYIALVCFYLNQFRAALGKDQRHSL